MKTKNEQTLKEKFDEPLPSKSIQDNVSFLKFVETQRGRITNRLEFRQNSKEHTFNNFFSGQKFINGNHMS